MEKSKTAAFTGHRNITGVTERELFHLLGSVIRHSYGQGYRMFISGMAVGFDMPAAEVVVRLRNEHPDIRFEAAIPFPGQPERFSSEDKRRYSDLLDSADGRVILSEYYHSGCFHRRNDYLIDRASKLIAFYDGNLSGGTHYTCTEAVRRGLGVINLMELP